MYLMYHYSTYTGPDLAMTPELRIIWRNTIPEEAAKHPFLMHGILAISAMHLADKDPSSTNEFLPLSIHHQNLAISSFRTALTAITEENCTALFAQAAILSISCKLFSCIKARRQPPFRPSLDDIIEPYILTRGVGEVVGVAQHWIAKGPLQEFLHIHEAPRTSSAEQSATIKLHFENMRELFRRSVADATQLTALLESTDVLQKIWQELERCEPNTEINPGVVWKWPNRTPLEYTIMLRQYHPQALFLYAHFVMLSKLHDGYWYFRDWGSQAVGTVSAALPAEMRQLILYPDFLDNRNLNLQQALS